MSRTVSYKLQTVDNPNPLARFAHRSRHSYGTETMASVSPPSGSIADFGAGTGAMLRDLAERRPDLTLVAVEPYMQVADFDGRVVPSLGDLDEQSVDVLSAFEVCEHLSDEALEQFLVDAVRVLRDDGLLVISVPIMVGPVVLPKAANRMWLHRRRSEYSVRELGRALVGRPVERPESRASHKGFDFRAFDTTVRGSFDRSTFDCSPMRRLPWWGNSQVFMTYHKSEFPAV